MFEVLYLSDGITALYQRECEGFEVLFFKKNEGFLARARVQRPEDVVNAVPFLSAMPSNIPYHSASEFPAVSTAKHRSMALSK